MTLKLGKKLNFKEPECKLTTKDYLLPSFTWDNF